MKNDKKETPPFDILTHLGDVMRVQTLEFIRLDSTTVQYTVTVNLDEPDEVAV